MNFSNKLSTDWLSAIGYRLILGVLLVCLSLQAHAACTFFDDFKDNNDGTVTDPRNGLIWKRCAEGFKWDGTDCKGSEKNMDWFDAMQAAKQNRDLGKADWRIPTKGELAAVVGSYDKCQDNRPEAGVFAASKKIAHVVKLKNENGSHLCFWSSSPKSELIVWTVGFNTGDLSSDGRDGTCSMRLVRASQSMGDTADIEFKTELGKIPQYKKLTGDSNAAIKRWANTNNSPTENAARQGRQVCEAQKQTCYASCPSYNDRLTAFGANNAHFQCKSRCGQISCN